MSPDLQHPISALVDASLRAFPDLDPYSAPRRAWRRFRPRFLWERSRVGRVTTRFVAHHGLGVHGGPFRGMTYVPAAVGHTTFLVPKLVGSYERELAPVVGKLMAADFGQVINVGAGEGYYAVGMARGMPRATVVAFERDPGERALCGRLAAANQVGDRVVLEGTCSSERLMEVLHDRSLVVMDCEGCELDLLCPRRVPRLAQATILAELHPSANPAIPDELEARFRSSHAMTAIKGERREPREFEELLGVLLPEERDLAISEWRSGPAIWALWAPLPPNLG